MIVMLDIENASECDQIPVESDFQRWVESAVATLALAEKPRLIAIRIVDPIESAALNNEYRNKDKPTNVLSFPCHLPDEIMEQLPEAPLGDLVICAAVVHKEANEQNKSVSNHWAHMVIHGTLHLAGYDHDNDDEAQVMESLEISILSSLDIKNPYEIH